MEYLKKIFKEKDVKYFFFLLLTPLLFCGIVEFAILFSLKTFINLVSSTLFLCITTGFYAVFPKARKVLAVLLTPFVYIPCLVSVLFVMTYQGEFSQHVVSVILNTNLEEAMEVTGQKTSVLNIFVILGFITNAAFCLMGIFKYKVSNQAEKISWKKRAIFGTLIIAYSALPRYIKTTPFVAYSYCMTHRKFNREIYRFFNTKTYTPPEFGSLSLLSKEKKQTFVFVIGESADRNHLGIYGYDFNNTTPNFSGIKHELYTFKDVTSCDIWTTDVISKIFIFGNFQNGDLISLCKAAGFKTFWISNQYHAGKYDFPSTFLSKICDFWKYITKNDAIGFLRKNFDENLLPHVRTALQDPADKKVIFVHLMGSHSNYHSRYPKNFEVFPVHDVNFSKKKAKLVAEYDTAIRYTDYVLNEILTMLKAQNTYSAMLYMPDHGEDVRDTKDSICGRSTNITRYMQEIPFVVWVSDQYKEEHRDFINSWNLNKPYNSIDFAHSFSDFLRVTHNKFIPEKSIFR